MAHEIEVRAANIVSAVGLVLLLVRPKLAPTTPASGSLGRESIETGVASEGVSNPQPLLERQRLVHAARLGASPSQNRAELEALYSQAATLAAGVAGQTVNPAAQPQSKEFQPSQPVQLHRTM